MIGIDIALLILIIILAIKLWDCSTNLDRAEFRIDLRGAEINELKQKCDAHKKSIEYLSKSVRELNGVVEAAVKVKEETSDNKPDTKALISGWDADEPEPIQQHISKEEWSMQLVQAILNCQRIEPLSQQCIYPWSPLQTGLLSQTQQCIYPWQPWQPLQTGALNAGMGVTYRQ